MGIQNGPAPEGRATGATDWMTTLTMERDSLQAQLQESERLRQEAVAACETMRHERDDLQAKLEAEQQASEALRAELAAAKQEATKTGWVVVGSHLPNREQLDAEITRLKNNLIREADERKGLQQQVAALQAQLEAEQRGAEGLRQESRKTFAISEQNCRVARECQQQVKDLQAQQEAAAERLERVQQMIGHVLGWYTCTDWLDEVERAEAWEQVGELLGRLQREAG